MLGIVKSRSSSVAKNDIAVRREDTIGRGGDKACSVGDAVVEGRLVEGRLQDRKSGREEPCALSHPGKAARHPV